MWSISRMALLRSLFPKSSGRFSSNFRPLTTFRVITACKQYKHLSNSMLSQRRFLVWTLTRWNNRRKADPHLLIGCGKDSHNAQHAAKRREKAITLTLKMPGMLQSIWHALCPCCFWQENKATSLVLVWGWSLSFSWLQRLFSMLAFLQTFLFDNCS